MAPGLQKSLTGGGGQLGFWQLVLAKAQLQATVGQIKLNRIQAQTYQHLGTAIFISFSSRHPFSNLPDNLPANLPANLLEADSHNRLGGLRGDLFNKWDGPDSS
jgi:hypothetical protein